MLADDAVFFYSYIRRLHDISSKEEFRMMGVKLSQSRGSSQSILR